MAWQFKPLTYDGTDINNATYVSKFVVSDNPLDMINSDPQEVVIPGDYSFPEAPRAQLESGRLYLMVQLASNTQAAIDAARLLFDRMKGAVSLTVQDGGVPTTWTLSVRCERLVTIAPKIVVATLYVPRPIMESALRTDSLRTISATPTTWSPTPQPIGTVRSYPSFDLTATVAKSNANDYTRRWQVIIAWRSEFPGEDSVGGPYPIDVANDALDHAAEVTATRSQADGDDIAVYVDGVLTPRVLHGENTTSLKVWCGIHFSPGLKATLLATMASAGSPANGGEIEVSDELGLLGWPERGYFVIDNECLFYGERTTTKLKKLKRGQRNTTAAAHSAATRLDWVEHDIQIVSNWSAAPTPTAALASISTSLSTNLAHTYASFFTSPGVKRLGQMLRRYTADNVMSPMLSVIDSTGFFIVDHPPGGTLAPYNNLEIYVPCGVKAAASALAFDCMSFGGVVGTNVPGADIVLNGRVYGIDVDTGVEQLLATYKKADRGLSKTLTPDTVLNRVRFNAVYAAITGHYNSLATATAADLLDSTDQWLQRFTLDEATKIEALAVWAKEAASGDTRDILLSLTYPVSGSDPEPANTVLFTGNATVLNAGLLTTYGWVSIAVLAGVPIVVPAGSAWDLMAERGAGAGTVTWGYWTAGYSKGNQWDETASTWAEKPEYDFGFLIMGDGSVVQPEAPTGMNGAVSWDNHTFTFDDATPRTPKYLRSAQETIYIHRGVISSDTTGQSITVFYIGAISELITIDCYRREVILDDTQGIYAPGAVTLSDPEQWMHMPPGVNTLRYVEATPGTVTITTKWKDGWA